MTKRDFFRLLIKVFGLYWLIAAVFETLPNDLGYIINTSNVSSVAWILFSVALVFVVFRYLVQRADFVIDTLELDKGFDEERIEMINFDTSTIIKLSMIIIGGMLIIRHIPELLLNSLYLLENFSEQQVDNSRIFYWTMNVVTIIVGYQLIKKHKKIETYLNKERSR